MNGEGVKSKKGKGKISIFLTEDRGRMTACQPLIPSPKPNQTKNQTLKNLGDFFAPFRGKPYRNAGLPDSLYRNLLPENTPHSIHYTTLSVKPPTSTDFFHKASRRFSVLARFIPQNSFPQNRSDRFTGRPFVIIVQAQQPRHGFCDLVLIKLHRFRYHTECGSVGTDGSDPHLFRTFNR